MSGGIERSSLFGDPLIAVAAAIRPNDRSQPIDNFFVQLANLFVVFIAEIQVEAAASSEWVN